MIALTIFTLIYRLLFVQTRALSPLVGLMMKRVHDDVQRDLPTRSRA